MRLLLIAFILLLFSACSIRTPAISQYRINIDSSPSTFTQTGCKQQSLKIAQAFSPSSLMTHDMNYGLGTHKQYKFTQSQWAESPNRAITAEILKYIRASKLFKNVQISKSRSRNGVILETNIEDFMQYFSENEKKSYVHVRINFTLIDVKTSKVISTQTFESKLDVNDINAESGVIFLNKALANVIANSEEWLRGVCK